VASTVLPAGALAGRSSVTLTSGIRGTRVAVARLFAVLTSGTLVVPTLAVTVAPVVLTKTGTDKVVLPRAGTKVVVRLEMPLTVMVAVIVVPTVLVLLKTIVEVTVVPTRAVVGSATVVLISVTLTVSVAVTKLVFVPTDVDNEPAGIVLSTCGAPLALAVTTTETEQLELGGMTVPLTTVSVLWPAVANTLEFEQLSDALGVVALAKPVGYRSTKAVLNVADTSLCVLVKVITNNDVPPTLIELGAKVLETSGKLGVTASISATVQVPATQPVATLVFETPDGAEIEAVLVIWV
jgi:hypothetical protein